MKLVLKKFLIYLFCSYLVVFLLNILFGFTSLFLLTNGKLFILLNIIFLIIFKGDFWLSFDYKTTHFDKYYLIKLWTYLYFLNQKAVLYEDKRSVSNFWNKILKKENSKNKLSTKNVSNIDEWYFKSPTMILKNRTL